MTTTRRDRRRAEGAPVRTVALAGGSAFALLTPTAVEAISGGAVQIRGLPAVALGVLGLALLAAAAASLVRGEVAQRRVRRAHLPGAAPAVVPTEEATR